VGLDAFNKTFPDVIEIPEGGGEFDLGELAIPTTRPVVGRITNLPGAPNPSISFVAASEELQGASSVATIREAGAFTASAVAPGTYNLTYYDQTQRFGQRVALQNVTIPPGDGEFDMGEFAIDLGGSLRVTLSGVLPEANGFVSLSLTGEMQTPSGVQTASFGSEMLRGAESVALFAGLNAGPIDVRVNAGGYFVAQSQYTAQIVSETVTELEIPLYPQTYLQITIAQQDITLSAVRLTSKETGQSMDLVPVERIGSEMANRPGAVFAPREIRVNGLAEGAWIVDATATDGRTARQEYEIRLRQGTVGGELTFGGAR
jgi:hypothetical protein